MSSPFLVGLAAAGSYLAYNYVWGVPGNLTSVQVGGRSWRVQDMPDKTEAATLMSRIHSNISKLMQDYKSNPGYEQDGPAQRLLERFKVDNIMENSIHSSYTSYSENKGEKLILCLRDKDSSSYPLHDENTIMFVVLHELSHLMTESTGHTAEFWANFKRILHDAVRLGIYQQVNYSRQPVDYCGMQISDSPY
jgi:hypothetical protein